jgi:DNA polymerase-3 subunit gamma/tau
VALALYRKYRPQTFGEVIGQEHVTEPLIQALRSGRLNHAYLFSGPRGCGKTSSARILARSLNCAKGPTPEPCGQCDSCVALAPGGPGSVDVIEIDAASHGGVDDARDLREKAFFAPVASRYKVYVIDEAHMVTQQGFNALLKLVEEPPEFVVFVFATTEPEKVLGTIRSRTHHYPFRLIPPSVLRPYLEQLCHQERVHVEPAVFPLVVRAGGGSVRDSLSVLDQLIAGAGDQGVTYARAVALLGVTDMALIDDMVDALAAGDGAAAFATIDRVADAGHDPRRFATDLLERLRDLIVLQRVPEATGSGIIDAPTDLLERMAGQAARIGPATLSRLADIVHNGLTEMRGTTAPRLLLELITARMLLPGADDSVGGLLHRLERMERRLGTAEPDAAAEIAPVRSGPAPVESEPRTRPAPQPAAPPAAPAAQRTVAPAPPRPAAAATTTAVPATPGAAAPAPSTVERPVVGGQPDAATVRRVWDEVLTLIRRRSSRVHAFLREGAVRDVHGDEVVLLFRSTFHADRTSENAGLVVEALHEVLGGAWRVRVELGGDERTHRTAPARPSGTPAREADERPAPAAGSADWPETARPGGPATSAPAQAAPATNRGGAGGARAAKAAPARASRPASSRGSRSRDEAPPPDEPPFDSDYGGFDPGDEPLDDGTPALRVSSEEQAMRAVTEHFAVERIGDTTPRA